MVWQGLQYVQCIQCVVGCVSEFVGCVCQYGGFVVVDKQVQYCQCGVQVQFDFGKQVDVVLLVEFEGQQVGGYIDYCVGCYQLVVLGWCEFELVLYERQVGGDQGVVEFVGDVDQQCYQCIGQVLVWWMLWYGG